MTNDLTGIVVSQNNFNGVVIGLTNVDNGSSGCLRRGTHSMIPVLIRLALLALLIYLVVRVVRFLFRDAPQSVGATSGGTLQQDSPYSGEVLLTGRLRVQVVSAGSARPLSGRRVSFRACGFT